MAVMGKTIIDLIGNVLAEPSPADGAQEAGVAALAASASASLRYAWVEVARHAVVGYIIAGLQRSEVRITRRESSARDHEHYLWGVRPNPNQSRSEFVARVVDQMFFGRNGCALVVPARDSLWVADGWTEERRPGMPSVFTNVSIEGSTEVAPRAVSADEAFVFRVPETVGWRRLLGAVSRCYAEMAESSAKAFQDKNARRWLLRVDQQQAGTAGQTESVNAYLKNSVAPFVKGTDAALPLFRGYDLARAVSDYSGGETTLDVVQVRREAFNLVANCMRVPVSFLEGNVNNFEVVFESFLAFCLDPVARAIADEICAKSFTERDWADGCHAAVDTSHVRHVDLFAVADKVEKLVGSSIDTPNEIRLFTGQERVDAPGMDEYRMTKNHEVSGGGETNGDSASTDAAAG